MLQKQSCEICEAKFAGMKGDESISTIIVEDINTSLSIIGRITKHIVNDNIETLNTTHQPIRPNRHLYNTQPNKTRIYFLFKSLINIYQGTLYPGQVNKLQ